MHEITVRNKGTIPHLSVKNIPANDCFLDIFPINQKYNLMKENPYKKFNVMQIYFKTLLQTKVRRFLTRGKRTSLIAF